MTEGTEVLPAGTAAGGGDVAVYDPDLMVGLEDITATDLVIPRLVIQHKDGRIKDNLSNAEYEQLDVILLAMVKQRVMFHPDVEDGDRPMCKSPDFEHGFPNTSDETPATKRFPWQKSNFDPANFPATEGLNGHITLPCGSCVFKDWPKAGSDDKKPPCAEQWTFILLYRPDEGQAWQPGLFSVQKSGMPPAKKYITYFGQTNTPLFTVHTRLSFQLATRGQVTYSTPIFTRGEATPRENWSEWATTARNVREFIRQPPRPTEDDEGGFVSADAATAAPAEAATSAPAPAEAPATPVTPAPAAPAAEAAPAAAAPAPAAVAPPVAAPAAAPAAQPAPASDPSDDLPF